MKNNNMLRLLTIFISLVLIFPGIPQVFGSEKGGGKPCADCGKHMRQPILFKTRATVDAVSKRGDRMVVDDQYIDIPKGTPRLRPGDIIEIYFDKKSGKIVKITKVGVDRGKHQPFTGSGDKMGNTKASKANHGRIRKMDGKWQNY